MKTTAICPSWVRMHSARQRQDAFPRVSGVDYDWRSQCIITAGGMSGILNCLLAMLEPGDEVIVTDPTYAGIINRIRLAGGVHRLCPSDSLTSTDGV